jgi:hypothetical protein
VKEEKAVARNHNNKVDARNNLYSRLQFEELFSHLPASVLLRDPMSPRLSGSIFKHRGFTEHRSFIEHRGFIEHHDFTEHQAPPSTMAPSAVAPASTEDPNDYTCNLE